MILLVLLRGPSIPSLIGLLILLLTVRATSAKVPVFHRRVHLQRFKSDSKSIIFAWSHLIMVIFVADMQFSNLDLEILEDHTNVSYLSLVLYEPGL